MKKHIVLLGVLALLLASCKNTEPVSSSSKAPSSSDSVAEPSSSSQAASVSKKSITVVNPDGVAITGLLDSYLPGATVAFSLPSAPKGKKYEVKVGTEEILGTDNAYSFVMPENDTTVTVSVLAIDYAIALSPDSNTALEVKDQKTTGKYGEKIEFTVQALDGYSVSSVKVKAGETEIELNASGNEYSFAMPDSPVSISASSLALREITVVSPYFPVALEGEGLTQDKKIVSGKTVTATLGDSNDPSYAFQSLSLVYSKDSKTVQEELSGKDGIYSFVMPDYDISLRVDVKKMYSVSETLRNTAITYSPAKKDYYKEGETVSFSLAPDTDYELGEVSVAYKENDETKPVSFTLASGVYSFAMPDYDTVISCTSTKIAPVSQDPWKTETKYESEPTDTSNSDVQIQISVDFQGDGTLTYLLGYLYFDEEYDDWDPFTAKEEIKTPIPYTYDSSTELITFNNNNSDHTIKVLTKGADGVPASIAFQENLGNSEYYAVKNVAMKKK